MATVRDPAPGTAGLPLRQDQGACQAASPPTPPFLQSFFPAVPGRREPVARRAGHGVAVLLKIYAHCIDGQAAAANYRIAEALGTPDAEQDPGDEGDGDIEQAS